MFIYKITNTVNGKCYIGQTRSKRVSDRITKHQTELRKGIHANEHLQRSWIKYGANSFSFEVIATALDLAELNLLEVAWISEMNTMKPNVGYNKESGGHHGPKILSKESKEKISKALTGRPVSEQTRQKISESNKIACKGILHTEKTKLKMSESHKQRNYNGNKHHFYGKPGNHSKPVQCTTNGKVYSSVRKASLGLKIDYSNIFEVLKGRKQSHKGYSFIYMEII